MVTTNAVYGSNDNKGDLVELRNIKGELVALTNIGGESSELKKEMVVLPNEVKATQMVIVEGAESTMKSLKGDAEPMKLFLQKAEAYWGCLTRQGKCSSTVASLTKCDE
ncbi:hypothetical protein L873DRAFT_1467197 [Choiromyces venosus 120613-1]|uniref:Uncharacterized protein n=1 Tax=Choiromyces venosus 120613-1 TaxID=1336337 RepID=A0A3N4J7P7_9PEZI|nr:hypothetical protein L873DRAFT_1467197 [Choiromyces venosus 120613-1]